MRIKGTSKPCCKLCRYAFLESSDGALLCKLNDEKTDANNQCKKFSYDIYKYEPAKKPDFSSFSATDFEI